jgi:8-oxo-dGTP pyrophosphatase MutT (NUDIX family)
VTTVSARGSPEPPDRRFAPGGGAQGGDPAEPPEDRFAPGEDQGVPAAAAADPGGPPGWLRDLAVAAAQSPVPPLLRPPPDGGRASAVLVLFGDGPDGPDLLLVQRGPGLRRHSGQPAFPGGAVDPGDGGPVPAALREAAEEAGVDPTGVEVLAVLPDLFIARSGFAVTPVLAWWRRPVPVAPADPPEVTAVARVPLSELADPARRLRIRHPSGMTGPAFRVRGMLVWGFTAALVDRLLTLGGWEQPWDHGRVEELPPETFAAGS